MTWIGGTVGVDVRVGAGVRVGSGGSVGARVAVGKARVAVDERRVGVATAISGVAVVADVDVAEGVNPTVDKGNRAAVGVADDNAAVLVGVGGLGISAGVGDAVGSDKAGVCSGLVLSIGSKSGLAGRVGVSSWPTARVGVASGLTQAVGAGPGAGRVAHPASSAPSRGVRIARRRRACDFFRPA